MITNDDFVSKRVWAYLPDLENWLSLYCKGKYKIYPCVAVKDGNYNPFLYPPKKYEVISDTAMFLGYRVVFSSPADWTKFDNEFI